MEGKVVVAMEELKILDLDFGKVIVQREEIIKSALDMIKENVKLQDRKEWEWNVKRSRRRNLKGGKFFTVPILIQFCRRQGKDGEISQECRHPSFSSLAQRNAWVCDRNKGEGGRNGSWRNGGVCEGKAGQMQMLGGKREEGSGGWRTGNVPPWTKKCGEQKLNQDLRGKYKSLLPYSVKIFESGA